MVDRYQLCFLGRMDGGLTNGHEQLDALTRPMVLSQWPLRRTATKQVFWVLTQRWGIITNIHRRGNISCRNVLAKSSCVVSNCFFITACAFFTDRTTRYRRGAKKKRKGKRIQHARVLQYGLRASEKWSSYPGFGSFVPRGRSSFARSYAHGPQSRIQASAEEDRATIPGTALLGYFLVALTSAQRSLLEKDDFLAEKD